MTAFGFFTIVSTGGTKMSCHMIRK